MNCLTCKWGVREDCEVFAKLPGNDPDLFVDNGGEDCPLFQEYVPEVWICPKHPKLGKQLAGDPCGACWIEGEKELSRQLQEWQSQPQACPHGNTEGCDHCDHLSDLAYDAAREQR